MTKCETDNRVLANRMDAFIQSSMEIDDLFFDEKHGCRRAASDSVDANFDDIINHVENMLMGEHELAYEQCVPPAAAEALSVDIGMAEVAEVPPAMADDDSTLSADDDNAVDIDVGAAPSQPVNDVNAITITIPDGFNAALDSDDNRVIVSQLRSLLNGKIMGKHELAAFSLLVKDFVNKNNKDELA